jgi:RimJ/RimL family protein N-acetyltransferase
METLQTARLRLEPLAEAHADGLFAGLGDERLYAHIAERPPVSLEALRARYRRLESRRSPDGREQWLNWVLFVAGAARPLGYVQATVHADGVAEVAYLLLRAAWGSGYAREATQAMVAHLRTRDGGLRFRATVDPRNAASVRLLEALGFARVALRRDAEQIGGLWTDEAEYRLGPAW